MASTNEEVAALLREYAELLGLTGGDQFRVRSYEKAAKAIAGYPDDLAALPESALTKVPGVGSSVAAKIAEYRRTGTIKAVDDLRPELADDPEFRVRFRREVAVLGSVNGLCTVRVLEADTESARPFLATEYADGPSLAEYVSQHGPLGPDMLQGLAVGLAEALTAIHAAGLIHRDLKPGNVLLTQSGPKVIDFGIAQALDSMSLTKTGMTVGSPGFMAPEQIQGQAGQPTDVFAWGLTMAYAATGQSPFGTGPMDAIFYRMVGRPARTGVSLIEVRGLGGCPGSLAAAPARLWQRARFSEWIP